MRGSLASPSPHIYICLVQEELAACFCMCRFESAVVHIPRMHHCDECVHTCMQAPVTRVEVFLQWLRCLLFQMLLEVVNLDDRSEALWRAALGCLLHLVCTGGHPNVECMAGLSNAPLAVLLKVAEAHAWCAFQHHAYEHIFWAWRNQRERDSPSQCHRSHATTEALPLSTEFWWRPAYLQLESCLRSYQSVGYETT
jgi:hypothetical protein